MTKTPRGVTLVELLVVVAIIGVMAGLASVGLQTMARFGGVNGGADSLTRLMATLRARAMTERCRYILQINGPNYALAAAGAPVDVPKVNSTAFVYRKGVCNAPGVAFEPGLPGAQADKLVDQYSLEDMHMVLFVPALVLPAQLVTTQSVSFSWNELGQRAVAVDDDSDGVSTPVPTAAPLTVTVRASPGNDPTMPSRDMLIPFAGRATSP